MEAVNDVYELHLEIVSGGKRQEILTVSSILALVSEYSTSQKCADFLTLIKVLI